MKSAVPSLPVRSEPKVVRFGCHNTRRNLPEASAAKRGETNFLARFEKAYFATLPDSFRAFARGREFSLNGYGRADVIWLAWRDQAESEDFSALSLQKRIQLTAIEAKLKDWRKGLIQASRYRHFANRSILVLPPGAAEVALKFLPVFKQLGVGLWEFDHGQDRIVKHSTPRMGRAFNQRVHLQAIGMIEHRLKLR